MLPARGTAGPFDAPGIGGDVPRNEQYIGAEYVATAVSSS